MALNLLSWHYLFMEMTMTGVHVQLLHQYTRFSHKGMKDAQKKT